MAAEGDAGGSSGRVDLELLGLERDSGRELESFSPEVGLAVTGEESGSAR